MVLTTQKASYIIVLGIVISVLPISSTKTTPTLETSTKESGETGKIYKVETGNGESVKMLGTLSGAEDSVLPLVV